MQVTLIDYTGKGNVAPARFAAAKLIFTKSTRLNMSPDGFDGIFERCLKNDGWMNKQLEAISRTLPSSWEFVNYTFCIQHVTRAFTHQLVRTRTASYAQQAMRVVDMSAGFTYETPPSIDAATDGDAPDCYHDTMEYIRQNYATMVEQGIATEDARGILPTNIHTNIVMSANLRTMADLIRKRSSGRVQGEYRTFIDMAAKLIVDVHPFAPLFINDRSLEFARDLDDVLDDLQVTTGVRQNIWKLVDKLRGADE